MGKIAGFLTGQLLAYNLIEESEQELYEYGLERVLSKVISYSAFLVLALCIRQFIPTVLFLGFLLTLRGRTGGYHASTELRCFVSSMGICVLAVKVLIPFLVLHKGILGTLYVISVAIIFLWAPINHPNVDFSIQEIQQYRWRARKVLIQEMLLVILMWIVQVREEYSVSAMAGTIVCALLMCLAKLTKQEV